MIESITADLGQRGRNILQISQPASMAAQGNGTNISNLPMPANAQQKPAAAHRKTHISISQSQTARFALRYGLFQPPIRPVSAANTACFRMQDRMLCNSLKAWRLARTTLIVAFYPKSAGGGACPWGHGAYGQLTIFIKRKRQGQRENFPAALVVYAARKNRLSTLRKPRCVSRV